MATATYTKAGAKATTAAKLDKAVFGVSPDNHELLKLAYNVYLANGRQNNAVTKTRGLVSGGGIAFGPTGLENYTKQLNVKAKRLAIRQALSLAAEAGKVSVIEDLDIKSGKTADLVKLLAKLTATRNVLVVVEHKTDELVRAAGNIQQVKVVAAHYVNTFDTLNADTIIFTAPALKLTTAWLTKDTK